MCLPAIVPVPLLADVVEVEAIVPDLPPDLVEEETDEDMPPLVQLPDDDSDSYLEEE
jgi:hypothetical protein